MPDASKSCSAAAGAQADPPVAPSSAAQILARWQAMSAEEFARSAAALFDEWAVIEREERAAYAEHFAGFYHLASSRLRALEQSAS